MGGLERGLITQAMIYRMFLNYCTTVLRVILYRKLMRTFHVNVIIKSIQTSYVPLKETAEIIISLIMEEL